MKLFTKIVICTLLGAGMLACEKDKDFSDIPELTFRDFERLSASNAVWRIGFQDGDGDIGSDVGDTAVNFVVTIYNINDGVDSAMSGQGYRIPIVENIRTASGIEGEIKFDLTGLDAFKLIQGVNVDSIYYEGYVIDRSGNRSNSVNTPRIKL